MFSLESVVRDAFAVADGGALNQSLLHKLGATCLLVVSVGHKPSNPTTAPNPESTENSNGPPKGYSKLYWTAKSPTTAKRGKKKPAKLKIPPTSKPEAPHATSCKKLVRSIKRIKSLLEVRPSHANLISR